MAFLFINLSKTGGNFLYQPKGNSSDFYRYFIKIHKYRPFTDPEVPKGLYNRPRSVNTDPLGNPASL